MTLACRGLFCAPQTLHRWIRAFTLTMTHARAPVAHLRWQLMESAEAICWHEPWTYPRTMSRFTACLALMFSLVVASSAHAQDASPTPAQKPAPPPSNAPAANGEYVAPLSQTTQPSYVPQSVALSGPAVIKEYQEGAPVPAGYHAEQRARRGLVIAGAVTFGSMYLLSAMVAAIGADSHEMECTYGGTTPSCRDKGNPVAALWVPAIGPFIQMAKTDSSTGNLFLAIDGLAQTGGVVMAVYGLASPKTVLVRNDLGSVRVVPQVGKSSTGLALVGNF